MHALLPSTATLRNALRLHLILLSLAIGILTASAQNTLSPHSGFTQTSGGKGGQLIRVTSLEAHGPGSLAEALATKGPRIIVFEVAGVIDLDRHSLRINEPFVTVAGQTAPSPGVTLIRGGIGITTHDVVLQHLRVRPGEAGREKKSGWEVDGIGTVGGAYEVMVDHCSCTWATDENLSASGPRFEGESVEAWREHTSHKVTFSNCLIAEGLSRSTHAKGEHSKGSLIHDNTSNIAILGNLYASDMERCPLFKGGARGVIVNNFTVNPGRKAIHFGLVPDEWGTHPWVAGQMAIVGNHMLAGSNTVTGLALVSHSRGPLELYLKDNRALDRSGKALPEYVSLSGNDPKAACTLVKTPPLWPADLKPLPVEQVRDAVLTNAGARPWERDAIDRRIIDEARNNTGHIIDSEQQVGGYPKIQPVRAAFNPDEWDLATMEKRASKKR